MDRILIIDDDESVLFAYTRFLKREGIQTETAMRIADGVAKLSKGTYGTIVLDMNLPDGSALDVIPAIRMQHPDAAIAVVTGAEDPLTRKAAMDAGADEFLTKPLSMKALALKVAELARREKV